MSIRLGLSCPGLADAKLVVYFGQLLGAAGTQKLVELLKNQPKKDNFEVPPQEVEKLLHVDQL